MTMHPTPSDVLHLYAGLTPVRIDLDHLRGPARSFLALPQDARAEVGITDLSGEHHFTLTRAAHGVSLLGASYQAQDPTPAPITRAMLEIRCCDQPGELHTCTLCERLTDSPDNLCWPCRTEYRHYVTWAKRCPACGEVRVIGRQHEAVTHWHEECYRCDYQLDGDHDTQNEAGQAASAGAAQPGAE